MSILLTTENQQENKLLNFEFLIPFKSLSLSWCMHMCVCVCVSMYIYICMHYIIKPYSVFFLFTMHYAKSTPLQYFCLENPMGGGAWWAAVHGVPRSRTRLSDFTFTFHFPALEKEMATHSSVLAWRIPGTGEPGGLLSMGSHRVGHD